MFNMSMYNMYRQPSRSTLHAAVTTLIMTNCICGNELTEAVNPANS